MWVGEYTDTFYEDTFSLVCYKHKDQKHEIKNSEKIEKMLRETFTVMKVKCMAFVLEDDGPYYGEIFRKWLDGLKLFQKKFFYQHEEKVKHKDIILLIDSVTTFTLALFSKICCICTKVTSLDDLKTHRDKQELFQTVNEDSDFFEYTLYAVLTHSHYPKVKDHFGQYSLNLVNFAFAASCYTFALTFGTDTKEFWDCVVETSTYHQYKHRGNEAYNNKDYDSAFHIYLNALKHFPYSFHLFGNCAQVSLTLCKFKSAELLSRFALIINPQWCKAYYKLALALFHQKKIHKAHLVAAFGLKQCELLVCPERDTLKDYMENIVKECEECNKIECPYGDSDSKRNTQEEATYNADSNVPELTDSSDHSGSETYSMSDVDSSESAILCDIDKELYAEQLLDRDIDENEINEDETPSLPLDQNEDAVSSYESEEALCNKIFNTVESLKLNGDTEPELKEQNGDGTQLDPKESSCEETRLQPKESGCEGTELESKECGEMNGATKEDSQNKIAACNGNSPAAEELIPCVAEALLKSQKKHVKLEDVAKSMPAAWPKFVNLMNRFGKLVLQKRMLNKIYALDDKQYAMCMQSMERLSIQFSMINDLHSVAIAKQNVRLHQNKTPQEQHDHIHLAIEKEQQYREKLEELEKLVNKIESLPRKKMGENFPPNSTRDEVNEPQVQNFSMQHTKFKEIILDKSFKKIIGANERLKMPFKVDSPGPAYGNDMEGMDCLESLCEPKSDEGSTNVGASNADESVGKCLDYKTVVDFENALREGASAVKMGLMSLAVLHFSQALDMVQQVPELCGKFKVEAVAVKFVYGFACYKCYSFESMNRAITIFKEIINSEKQHLAPVYYLIGLSFVKFHKFRVALTYLNTVASMTKEEFNFDVSELLDENCIKEFTYESIQESLKDEICRCECPPPPDALCKYNNCILDPAIYFADLSFKKFMCVRCQERCVLQYHVTCWKAIKESFSKTDKEFLDCRCFTPDCEGLIIKVEMVGKDGVLERDFTSEDNYKPKKCVKQKKTKLEKKHEQKQRKRQTRLHSTSENPEAIVDEPGSVLENPQPIELHSTDFQTPTKTKRMCTGDAPCTADEEAKLNFEMPVNAEPMYIIKKDSNEKESEYKPSKHKERKKLKKNVLTIDEFCEGYSAPNVTNWNDYQLRLHRLQESKRVVEEQAAVSTKWSDGCKNAPVIPDSYNVKDAFELPHEVEAYLDTFEPEDDCYEMDETELRAVINLHFDNFLQNHGNVKVTDPVLLQEINKLSEKARDLIKRKGGFLPFLQGSKEFAVVNGELCHFNDMMELYSSPRNPYSPNDEIESISLVGDHRSELQIPSIVDESNSMYRYMDANECLKDMEGLDDFSEGYDANKFLNAISMFEDSRSNETVTVLNPNAVEYSPSKENSSEDNNSSQEILKNNSVECESLKANDNSLLSRVAGMRQELKSYSVVEAEKNSQKSPEPEPVKTIIEKVSDVQLQNDPQEKAVTGCPLFVDYFQSHFAALIKDGKKDKIHKAYESLKFLMHQLGRANEFLIDSSEQIGSSFAVSMVSQGVMKEDKELVQLTVEAEILKNFNRNLTTQVENVESQLTEALDRQMELQNKYQVETASLKKQLQDNESTSQDNMQELKKKHSTLEKELKLWRQRHNQQMDKEKASHTEHEIVQTRSKVLANKVSELEKELDNMKMEFQMKINSHNDILSEYEKQLQTEIDEKKKAQSDLLLAKGGLKDAELQILNLKKAEYLKAFGVTLTRVNSNIQDLKNGIQRMDNMNPIVHNTLKTLQGKLNEYIRDMHSTRLRFIGDIADQIKRVESGISLSLQPDLQIPTFPPLPTIDTILDKVQPEQTLPVSVASSEQGPSLNSFKSNDQLPQKSFQSFPSSMPHQSFQAPMPWSMSSATGIGGPIKFPLPNQPIGHLGIQTQQNSLFPNFNAPMFGGFQPRGSSAMQNVPPVSQVLPAPIGSQLPSRSSLVTDSFTGNFATGFSQKLPPGLCSQPSSLTSSMASFTTDDFKKQQLPLLSENKPMSLTPSLISLNDTEPLSQMNLLSEAIVPEPLSVDEDANSNKGLTFSNTVKKTVSNGGFVTVEKNKKPHHPDAAAALELDYSSLQQPKVVSKPSSLSGTETDATLSSEKANFKGGYRKIINTLKMEFPNLKDSEVMAHVSQYRADKGGKLSKLPFASIISEIKDIILRAKKQTVSNLVSQPINRPKALVNKTLTSCSTPAPPPPVPKTTATVAPWAKAPEHSENIPQNWITNPHEKSCTICLEEMTIPTAYKMDCGHQFHFTCIKQWLNKQSNCPVCRVHLLLPEDFPSLS